MRQFVTICFSMMQGVRKVLTMSCLVHRWSTLIVSSWTFVRATVIYSFLCVIGVMATWCSVCIFFWSGIRINRRMVTWTLIRGSCVGIAHYVRQIRSVDCLSNYWAVVHGRVCILLTMRGIAMPLFLRLITSREAIWVGVVTCTRLGNVIVILLIIAHVIFFSTLRTDTTESSKPSWSFIMVIAVIVSCYS